jgi:L-asparaginase/Glu-tRNA(Gln) amidotransferase subunit D
VIPSLVARGWVAADDLQPWKARLLLRLALAAGTPDRAALQALFEAE